MPKIQKRCLAYQIFHACDDVLKPRRRENPQKSGAVPEVRVQSKNMFVLYHTLTIETKVRLTRVLLRRLNHFLDMLAISWNLDFNFTVPAGFMVNMLYITTYL
jgi:hypothetical protein